MFRFKELTDKSACWRDEFNFFESEVEVKSLPHPMVALLMKVMVVLVSAVCLLLVKLGLSEQRES